MAIIAKFCEAGAMSGTKLDTGANSSTELQGLDATSHEATNRTTLKPISPDRGSTEIDEIDKLLERVEELEEQLEREGNEPEVKVVQDVERPTQEQIDRHEATHTHHTEGGAKSATKG